MSDTQNLKQQISNAYKLTSEIKGSYEALRDAALMISSQLARAGWLKAQARHAHGYAKARVAECEDNVKRSDAAQYLLFRATIDGGQDSKGNNKLPTEGTISAAIAASDEHELAMDDLRDSRLAEVDAQHLVDLGWDLVEALKHRSSMINSLAADRRAELSTDFLLRKQAQHAAEDRDDDADK